MRRIATIWGDTEITEGNLDEAFAAAFERDPEMRKWVLGKGRFARFSGDCRLLIEEQSKARSGGVKNWWRYWWCRLPDGTESETDLFFVFEANDYRFALHIENKPPTGILTMDQASGYRRRAVFMANKPRWLSYSDFETILLAPIRFIKANAEAASQFDRLLSYEEVARFVPKFSMSAHPKPGDIRSSLPHE